MFRKAIKAEAYAKAEWSATRLTCSMLPPTLMAQRRDSDSQRPAAEGIFHPLVKIAASAVSTDTLALHDRHNPLGFLAARESVEAAATRLELGWNKSTFLSITTLTAFMLRSRWKPPALPNPARAGSCQRLA